ncbi:copper amine oxidase N-terminal domain-containing protein [Clostridium sp. 'deep sea']|uniref:copper amine oxidase N-terminal domain-containing protein n=1 Tax=Clostridium sp. 'deep sea' TaxID=2779445 RepID=UPI0018967567|nr:copper amine oxidase N-terminal domain-containing protein [Clostridium sp. 'deep sea']QOR36865.1 copper amine oxidase N-terminal domain-containing protein [Clostridium sp. 'deep sea']
MNKRIYIIISILLLFITGSVYVSASSISLIINTNNAVVGERVELTGVANSNANIIVKVTDCNDAVVYFSTIKTSSSGDYNHSFIVPYMSVGTAKVVVGYGSNVASEELNITLPPDTTPPTITTSLVNGFTYSSSKTFTISVTDNIDTNPRVTVKLANNTITANSDGSYTVNLTMGTNLINIIATDICNNTNTEIIQIIRESKPVVDDDGHEEESDNTIVSEEQLQKIAIKETDQIKKITVDITIKQAVLGGSIRAAKKKQQPVYIILPSIEPQEVNAESVKQVTNLGFTTHQVSQVKEVGLKITGPQGTQIELSKQLLETMAKASQDLNLQLSTVPVKEVNEYFSEKDSVYEAKEINTNFSGETKLRFKAPQDVDSAKLKIKVIHSNGTIEEIIPIIVTNEQDNTYLEFTINSFSTFIIYKPAPKAKTIIKLTIDKALVTVNNTEINLDATAFIKDTTNRTLVPVRFVSEALGSKVEWLPKTRQVKIINSKEILLTIDSTEVQVAEEIIKIDSPAEIVNTRTFVPLRFVSESLGAEVSYNAKTREITIIK